MNRNYNINLSKAGHSSELIILVSILGTNSIRQKNHYEHKKIIINTKVSLWTQKALLFEKVILV